MRVNESRGPGQWLKTQNGELVSEVTSQVHLGSLVTNDQQSGKELGRRYCRWYHEEASRLLETCHNSLEAQGFQRCHHQPIVSAVWLRYYPATERRLEETGHSPSPILHISSAYYRRITDETV